MVIDLRGGTAELAPVLVLSGIPIDCPPASIFGFAGLTVKSWGVLICGPEFRHFGCFSEKSPDLP
jgi:hypothetical protein